MMAAPFRVSVPALLPGERVPPCAVVIVELMATVPVMKPAVPVGSRLKFVPLRLAAWNPLVIVIALATVRLAPDGRRIGTTALLLLAVSFMTTVPAPNGPEVIAPGLPTELTPMTTGPPPTA